MKNQIDPTKALPGHIILKYDVIRKILIWNKNY